MGEPNEKPEPVLYTAPSPEVLAELQEAIAEDSEPLSAEETEAYLRWLETGEGEPWPRERSA